MVTDNPDAILKMLRESLQDAFSICRSWLAGHGIRALDDPLDEAAARAVLEQAMRTAIAARADGSSGITVSVCRMDTDDPTQWCLWVFGAGIWYEQFSRSNLLDDQEQEGDGIGEDRSA